MSAPHPVTGTIIPTSNNPQYKPPPSRLDICFMKDHEPEQFSLFIRSWNMIMKEDFLPKAASFREIAGIHGMPYVPWLGDPDEVRQATRGPWLGYCNHASILFPSWHRPYLMLLEQSICDCAYGIASRFASEDKDNALKWKKAANELRFPFWDWTHPRTGELGIPDFFTTDEIELLGPKGEFSLCENALAFYRLKHPVDGFNNRWQGIGGAVYEHSARSYYKEWDRTYRHPQSQAKDVTDNYAAINDVLKDKDPKRRGSWADLTNNAAGMFAFPLNIPANKFANAWDEFSNTTFQSGHQNPANPRQVNSWSWGATSIEHPHNTVHLLVGGIGHMADNDTAGFDPIFFLHHCNVDRLLAFWEHIYPDYVAGTDGYLNPDGLTRTPFTQAGGTWLENDNQVVDDGSPLWPFRNSAYDYWNARYGHSLMYYPDPDKAATVPYNKYYTYPPIVYKGREVKIDTDPSNPTSIADRRKQRRYLQNYFCYDPIQAQKENTRLVSRMFAKHLPYADGPKPSGHVVVDNYRQFFIAASLDPTFIHGSHMLVISIDLPSTFTNRPVERYEIGRVAVLSRGSSERCGNCQAQRAGGVRVRGIIMIPHQLVVELLDAKHNEEDTADTLVIERIKSALVAELVMPHGLTHGILRSVESDEARPPSTSNRAPYLELLSSDVYQQLDSGEGEENLEHVPFDFEDWKSHDTLNKIETIGGEIAERQWVLLGE